MASEQLRRRELAISIYARHDRDGKGALDKSALNALIDDFCQTLNLELAVKERDKLLGHHFAKSDTNHDGVLSREEFTEFAATLDSLASSLGGAALGGDVGGTVVPKGTRKSQIERAPLFHLDGGANMALFELYDTNKDNRLDVVEAVELLKATCGEMDITTEWITPSWVERQFRTAVGRMSSRYSAGEGDGDEATLGRAEFQVFCSNIMNFMVHLGSVMERNGPAAPEAAPAAASPGGNDFDRSGATDEDLAVGDPPERAKKTGCGCFG